MPMNPADYPPNWREISRAVRDAAGNRCQQCGVANGAIGARDRDGKWHDECAIHALNSAEGEYLFGEFPAMVKIVLTVHHDFDPADTVRDKMDCSRLIALCQRCHLNADRPHHLAKAAETRRRKRDAMGRQLELIGGQV